MAVGSVNDNMYRTLKFWYSSVLPNGSINDYLAIHRSREPLFDLNEVSYYRLKLNNPTIGINDGKNAFWKLEWEVIELLTSPESVLWLDAEMHDGTQLWRNLGSGGTALDARMGSTTGADTNDPQHLVAENEGYVYFPGSNGNYASTPSTAELSPTGDFEIICELDLSYIVTLNDSKHRRFFSKDGSYSLGFYDRKFVIQTFSGTVLHQVLSLPFTIPGKRFFKLNYYSSPNWNIVLSHSVDKTNWTTFYTYTDVGVRLIDTNAVRVSIGSNKDNNEVFLGNYYGATFKNGSDIVFDLDFSNVTKNDEFSVVASTGQTVTFTRYPTGRKLEVMPGRSNAGTSKIMFGADDYARIENHALLNFSASESFSLILVAKVHATPPSYSRYIDKNEATLPFGGYVLINHENNNMYFVYGDNILVGGENVGVLSTYDYSQKFLMAGVRDTSLDEAWTYIRRTKSATNPDNTTGDIGGVAPLQIGSNPAGGFAEFVCDAVILYRGALTPALLNKIADKYGAN